MRFSLHIFFALAALGFVSAAATLGAEQGFASATPGRVAVCGSVQQPCGGRDQGEFQQAANTIAR
jgi:hypothetical protein